MGRVWLRPLCWLERHNWLLQHEEAVAWWVGSEKPYMSYYHYQCQRCNAWNVQEVINLDNEPTLTPEKPL